MAAELKARPEQKNVYMHFNIKEIFSNLFSTLSTPQKLGILAAITIAMYAAAKGLHDPATSVSTLPSPVMPRWLSFWPLGATVPQDNHQKAYHQKLVDKILYNPMFCETHECVSGYDTSRLIRNFRDNAALREELTKGLLFLPRSLISLQANTIFKALIQDPEGRKFLLEYPEIIRSITKEQAEQFIFQNNNRIEPETVRSDLEYLASTSKGRAFLFAPENQHLRDLITSEVFGRVTAIPLFGVTEITSIAYELLRTVDGRAFLEQDARLSAMARTPEALASAALGVDGIRYQDENSVETWDAIIDWASKTPAGRVALDQVGPPRIVTEMSHSIPTL